MNVSARDLRQRSGISISILLNCLVDRTMGASRTKSTEFETSEADIRRGRHKHHGYCIRSYTRTRAFDAGGAKLPALWERCASNRGNSRHVGKTAAGSNVNIMNTALRSYTRYQLSLLQRIL